MKKTSSNPDASRAPQATRLREWRILGLLVAMFLLFPALACNYPGLLRRTPTQVSGDQLRQTLAALEVQLTQAAQPTETPFVPVAQPTQPPATTPIQPDPQEPPTPVPPVGAAYSYTTRSGDTPPALSARFGVEPGELILPPGQPWEAYLPEGLALPIPNRLEGTTPSLLLLPDAELVYSPSALDFDVQSFIAGAGGYLSSHREKVDDRQLSGAEIIQRVADQLSVNPRLLLALLEFRSGWVFGQPADPENLDNPLGLYIPGRTGLYQEITIAATQLNVGYYGWRAGSKTEIQYKQGRSQRLEPTLNASSAALQHLFALLYREEAWNDALYGPEGFAAKYTQNFGDPWGRAQAVGPLIPANLVQPPMELPFAPGERWSLTAGPHPSWNAGTPRGALDLSPVTGEPVCAVSRVWVTAVAPGIIVRAANNTVVLDVDGDGLEQTGWALFYFHLAGEDLVQPGISVGLDHPLGHPSCEGGRATGKHVHIARKYNGEWLLADGPLPFVLSGWTAQAEERNYYGNLVKGDQVVSSNSSGMRTSIIIR